MSEVFFEKLQNHSDAKLKILNNYYIPWLRKINLGVYNSGKCLVIDGFAGEGVYQDGQIGSPIYLIDGAIGFLNQLNDMNRPAADITIILVENQKSIFNKLVPNIQKRYSNTHKQANEENDIVHFSFENYPSLNIHLYNSSFEETFSKLVEVRENHTLIPSFCFVDPFGFSHTPFELFEKYLQNDKSELLFNFMYEEINRFINSNKNEQLIETYQKLFGISDIAQLRDEIGGGRAQERKQIVIDFYSRKLLQDTEARYVLDFEFKKNGRAKMFLIYATKNINGLKVMKNEMWKIDDSGSYVFDDRNDASQISFDLFSNNSLESNREELASIIKEEFSGSSVTMDEIEHFVLTKTIFPLTNYFKQALTILEKNKDISVERTVKANRYSFNEKKVFRINF